MKDQKQKSMTSSLDAEPTRNAVGLGRRPAYGKVTIITTIHKRLNERKTPAQPAEWRARTDPETSVVSLLGCLA